MVYEETLREMCLFSLKNKSLSRDLTAVYSYLMGEYREGGVRLQTHTQTKIIRNNRQVCNKEDSK